MESLERNLKLQIPELIPKTEEELIANIKRNRVYRLNDKFFKFAFGRPERKPLFLDLVNSVVFPDGSRVFSDIDFADREFSPFRVGGKECHLDIVGILDDGEQLNVEVQVFNRGGHEKRSVFYWSMLHCGQLESGEPYIGVRRTISLNILAFDLFDDEPDFRNSFSVRNDESGRKLCDDLTIIYLEIPKYRRCGRKPLNKLERWMAYLAEGEGAEMAQIAEQDPMIAEALDLEKLFLMDQKQRLGYIQSWKQMMDEASRDESIRRLAKAETARNLLEMGMEPAKIAQATGLSEAAIRALRQ